MLALKKVRFDNFEPESVRFMSREIMILRKLEGLITSRLSTSVYLVFEYTEHDIVGLSSCPDIKFSESQVRIYGTLDVCSSIRELPMLKGLICSCCVG